jgi:hypothetical protein
MIGSYRLASPSNVGAVLVTLNRSLTQLFFFLELREQLMSHPL